MIRPAKSRMPGILLILGILLVLPRFACTDNVDAAPLSEMKALIEKAGPVPDEILYPRKKIKYDISISERLYRIWMKYFMGFRVTYEQARGKACAANQRAITEAVEMYNIDNPGAMMANLADIDVTDPKSPLVAGKYLKTQISHPENDCYYCNYGDLTAGGIIYCKTHGTLPEYRIYLARAAGVKLPEDNDVSVMPIIITGSLLIIFIPLFVIFRFSSNKEKQDNKIQKASA
ncbi:MAG: hypothetical protein Kow0029_24550 [Candidatus Rifleibacteriota bacterium]